MIRSDGEVRTSIYCRQQSHALWWTDVAYAPQDRMDPTAWNTLSPGSPFPDEPTARPTVCPLDGSPLLKAGELASAQSAVRWT